MRKTLREDRTAAERNDIAKRYAAGGESRKRASFICRIMSNVYDEKSLLSGRGSGYNGTYRRRKNMEENLLFSLKSRHNGTA